MNTFNILDFGAVADGQTNNAEAIQTAIDLASEHSGTVVIPAGKFLSGTLVLKSNIDFHLEKGAVLISSLNEADILDFAKLFEDDNACTGWDGGCFLFACHEQNITISGEGTIYGQGDKVFFDDNADDGFHECPLNVTSFRPRTTFFEDVENLVIRDITIRDAAFWTLHMAGCRNVSVLDIKILNDMRGANNDGIDPDCCKDVIIRGCLIKTGDDAIVVKTTKPMAERYGSAENIVISDCILYSHDSALKIGTETHADIRNIVFGNCVIKDCSRGIGIWARDGATIEDIHVHHVTGNVLKYADGIRSGHPSRWWGNGEPIFISSTYRDDRRLYPGKIRNISFDHIYMTAESSIYIVGEPDVRIENIDIKEFRVTMRSQGTQASGWFDEQPSIRNVYKHTLPVPAIYVRCVDVIYMEGKVKFIQPYDKDDNGVFDYEDTYGRDVHIDLL